MPNTPHSKPTTHTPDHDELIWAEQAAWELHNDVFPDPYAEDIRHLNSCTDPDCEFCHPPLTSPDPAPAPTYDDVPF